MKCQAGQEIITTDRGMEMETLEEEIFMDCTFDVLSDEVSSSSYATPPMFVPSVGRGIRRPINPLDIPLPQAYYDQLDRKRKATKEATPPSAQPVDRASKPLRGNERTAAKPKQVPATARSRPRGRGRGRVIEEGFQVTKPSVMQVRDLRNVGLPNGNADVEEGKARLMQMFLGRQSQFEIDSQFNTQYDSTGSSIKSAPTFDLKSDKDFPDIISKVAKGMPFRSSAGGSLDENLKRRARDLIARGKYNSSGDDGMSSSGDTGERRGVRSSCDADVDTNYNPSMSQHKARSSDENSLQALEGPNVLELIGLPSNLSREDLGDLLMGCGNIIEMRLLRDAHSGACIGLAYVRMENEDACELAISSYHDIESPFSERYDGDIPQLSVRLLPS